MIVDAHTHLATREALAAYNEPFRSCAELYSKSAISGFYNHPDLALGVQESVAHLRASGVEAAVIVNMDASFRWGTRLSNAALVETLGEHRDFYKVFASVDPRAPDAVAELRNAFSGLGCVGLKIHPSYQEVYPNDRELMYPLYEVCVEHNAPILFHTGSTRLYPAPIKYSQPVHLDEVAIDFPQLRIIMAHWGWPWVDEALAILWRNENIFVDLSGHLPRHLPSSVWHYMQMADLRHRFFFGSDYPFLSAGVLLKAYSEFDEWHCGLCNKTERWKDGVKERFLGQNFLDMLAKR
ncbi:MAG: amidohydrolase [Chloroflexi bacterium]|nr:amidohydrolase [Chloroflexota bacterium]